MKLLPRTDDLAVRSQSTCVLRAFGHVFEDETGRWTRLSVIVLSQHSGCPANVSAQELS